MKKNNKRVLIGHLTRQSLLLCALLFLGAFTVQPTSISSNTVLGTDKNLTGTNSADVFAIGASTDMGYSTNVSGNICAYKPETFYTINDFSISADKISVLYWNKQPSDIAFSITNDGSGLQAIWGDNLYSIVVGPAYLSQNGQTILDVTVPAGGVMYAPHSNAQTGDVLGTAVLIYNQMDNSDPYVIFLPGVTTPTSLTSGNFMVTETILPVVLTSFTVKAEGNSVKLQWGTASETNNKGFEIYRSGDDRKFIKLGVWTDNYSSLNRYTFTDKTPLNGNNYYKLVQIDNDGTATELSIKSIVFSLNPLALQLYPNPVTNMLNINFEPSNFNVAELIELNGMVLKEVKLTTAAVSCTFDLSTLPTGTYLVRLTGSRKAVYEKVIKK